jgi:hypothetical protein
LDIFRVSCNRVFHAWLNYILRPGSNRSMFYSSSCSFFVWISHLWPVCVCLGDSDTFWSVVVPSVASPVSYLGAYYISSYCGPNQCPCICIWFSIHFDWSFQIHCLSSSWLCICFACALGSSISDDRLVDKEMIPPFVKRTIIIKVQFDQLH